MTKEKQELKTPLEKAFFWAIITSPVWLFFACQVLFAPKYTEAQRDRYDACMSEKKDFGLSHLKADEVCRYWLTDSSAAR